MAAFNRATHRAHLEILQARTDVLGKFQHKLYLLICNIYFDLAMGIVIIANALFIGLNLDAEVFGADRLFGIDATVYANLEYVFLFIYALELFLRFFAVGIRCLKSGWVRFDCFLVVISSTTRTEKRNSRNCCPRSLGCLSSSTLTIAAL